MKWLALVLVLVVSPLRAQQQVGLDTTLVIIRVANFYPFPVTVYIEPLQGERIRVSEVSPQHEGYFPIPSRGIRKLLYFVVAVEGENQRTYRTKLVPRDPRRITTITIAVGMPPDSATVPVPRTQL